MGRCAASTFTFRSAFASAGIVISSPSPAGRRSATDIPRSWSGRWIFSCGRSPAKRASRRTPWTSGGGTPTVLGPDRLNRLLAAIRSRFPVAESAEITAEANPGTTTGDDFARLREGGFNRVSLGVQSFRRETLAALGRIHSVEDVRTAYRDARRAGFPSVGIDLIFGNPGQNEAEWQEDLDLAVTFLADHVSAYALTPEPGTPIHAAVGSGTICRPDAAA